ncbi:GyrI-like domain-containing protein [Maribacter sp. 2307ULW6-5]|uniref:GyrI-like domain-containing protein n=1 Tax=Maribacter sp. 2307ULW6-5 TaxID=3386275 RepID=UPI0039BC49E8
MEPNIVHTKEKRTVGQSITTSLAQDATVALWRGFGPRAREVPFRLGQHRISLQVYPPGYHDRFRPDVSYEKWALVEVSQWDACPQGMFPFTVPGGLYAVFRYKGPAGDLGIYQYIYGEWLPKSGYTLDQRPHFEVLGAHYDKGDANAQEDIHIPIKVL